MVEWGPLWNHIYKHVPSHQKSLCVNTVAWQPDGHVQHRHFLVSQEINKLESSGDQAGYVKFLSSHFDIPFKARSALVFVS